MRMMYDVLIEILLAYKDDDYLGDPLLLTSSDDPVLTTHPEQSTIQVIMIREPG